MRYTVSVRINDEREKVVQVIKDPEQFIGWMTGLSEYNIIKKTENHVGTVTELKFKDLKGRTTSMIEEVISIDYPNEIVTTYRAGSVYNRCINRFFDEGEETVYEMETIFKFGFIRSLFMWIFKPLFKKQTLDGMLSFKKYIEKDDE